MPVRLSLIFFFLFLAAKPAFSQTFFPTPGPLLQQEVALELANEGYIFFNNPSGDSLRLRWKKVETAYPAEWTIDLCDLGTCYVGIPAAGLMAVATGTTQPYLKLIVQPGTTPGSGWLWFRVYDDGQPENYADVFFSLYTPGVTAVQTPPAPSSLQAYPNPVSGVLNLDNNTENQIWARLVRVSGAVQWVGQLAARERLALDASNWPAGIYFLQTSANTQVVLRLN